MKITKIINGVTIQGRELQEGDLSPKQLQVLEKYKPSDLGILILRDVEQLVFDGNNLRGFQICRYAFVTENSFYGIDSLGKKE